MVGLHKSNSVSSHVTSALNTKSVPCAPPIRISLCLSPSDPIHTLWGLSVSPVFQMFQQELIYPKDLEEGVRLCWGPALKEPCKFTKWIIYYISYLEQGASIFLFAPHKHLGHGKGRYYHSHYADGEAKAQKIYLKQISWEGGLFRPMFFH